MNQLEEIAGKSVTEFLSLVGLRDPIIYDDSYLLPYLKKTLKNTPFADLEIGNPVPEQGFEHAVRFLGKDRVIKYASPEPSSLVEAWIGEMEKQKKLLFQYLPSNLVPFDYFPVPVSEEESTYMVVMEKVGGRPLADLSDEELLPNKPLVKSLLEFFSGNEELYRNHGVCVDVLGNPIRVFDPRYSKNIYAAEEGRAVVVDTILIPRKFDPEKVPAQYRVRTLYHSFYNYTVKPYEEAFVGKLQESLRRRNPLG